MSPRVNLYDVWHRHDDFVLGESQEQRYCAAAAAFAQWAKELVDRTSQNPGAVAINQAKVLLVDRYWAWYATVPKRHQNHIGQREAHICIFQVFAESYAGLRALELTITPPHLIEPPAPPPPPPVARIPALILGELED